ncbi:MAG: 50S ribosomal protein L24 [Bacilli bacterium]|nr:50S ribosomal protein L24 [Bacilli bacterium]
MKIKQGDKVIVIAGKDKGKEGTVTKTLKNDNKVIVEGVNIVKKHIKPNGGENGRIAEVEAPIHVSNVMMLDPKTKKGTKIGYTTNKDGKKIRVSRKSNEKLD